MWTLKKAWYRTFQFVFNICEVFLPQHSPELLQGAGSIKKLPAFIKTKGIDKVLIVTDSVLSKIGLLNSLFAACDDAKLSYVLYDGAEVNPSIECIEKALKMYNDNKCQGFIAFGGGSSMDCAKAAAARVARPNRTIAQLGGTLKVLKKVPTLFAVPTTAGTGSEATLAAVVTDYSTHHKYAIQDPVLLPKYAVLDPELTVGLPPHVTSTTGMDALTHSVEAYTNKFAPKYTRVLAEKSTKLIFENLEKAYADGKNLEARSNMLLASFYGGRAFSRACVGNVHAIAHTLGGLYGTPHGLANAIILPYVMEDFGPAVYKQLARLADIVGIKGSDDGEKARAFIAAIHQMNKDMNIPAQIDVIKDKDIPQMVEWAMKEANPIYPVPVIWDEEQFTKTINRIRKPVTEEAVVS
ncbi:MAG: iron-containing alcohol dehydrogenase [Oscillospiraceae bacterium]